MIEPICSFYSLWFLITYARVGWSKSVTGVSAHFDISNVLEDVGEKSTNDGDAEVDDENGEDDSFDGESLGHVGGDVTENVAADEDGSEAGEAVVHVAEEQLLYVCLDILTKRSQRRWNLILIEWG